MADKPEGSKDQPVFDFSKLNFNFGTDEGFKFEAQAEMLSAISSRLGTLVGKPSGYLETLPQSVQKRIKALKKLQTEHEEIDRKFEEEVRLLELKYHELHKPLLQKRTAFLTGKIEPTPADLPEETESSTDTSSTAEAKEQTETSEVVGIPEFWLTALRNHDMFSEAISEDDEEALKYLEDIVYEPLADEAGSFVLKFHFKENPYFTNEVLEKTYHISGDDEDEVVCESVDSSEIHWKEGKNLIEKAEAKDAENPSFFTFFTPPEVKEGERPTDSTVSRMETDFEMAVALKEEVIKNAVNWFTGEAISEREKALFGGDEDEDEEDDEANDDEEYNSDEDPDYTPTKQPKEEGNPECKQQ
jgi:nucleosome assembly protein 1-like 1